MLHVVANYVCKCSLTAESRTWLSHGSHFRLWELEGNSNHPIILGSANQAHEESLTSRDVCAGIPVLQASITSNHVGSGQSCAGYKLA